MDAGRKNASVFMKDFLLTLNGADDNPVERDRFAEDESGVKEKASLKTNPVERDLFTGDESGGKRPLH